MTTSIRLALDTRRANKEGLFPIKVCICHNRQTISRNTGLFSNISDWDENKQCIKSTIPNAKEINTMCRNIVLPYENYIKEHRYLYTFSTMSAADIFREAEIYQKQVKLKEQTDDFIYLLNDYVANCNKPNTIVTFRYMEKKLNLYLKTLSPTQRKLDFQTIDYRFLIEFDRWLTKNNVGTNTRGIIFRNIRILWNRAIDYEMISVDKYPFRKFKIPSARKEKEYLPIEGIRKLLSLDLSILQGEQSLERARDVFLLSFFLCGINPIDLFSLSKTQLSNNRISYVRSKVQHHQPTPIKIFIQPEAQAIIDKYKGQNMLLDFAEHYADYTSWYSHMRHRIDRLSIMIGYPQLTLYWARYSWATYAAGLDVPINVIGKALGHADATLAEERYISFDWNKVDIANRRVIDYVMGGVVLNSIPAPKFVEKVSKKG